MNKILELSKKNFDAVQKLRHQFHMNPELGFEEFETSKTVQDELTKMGIEFEIMSGTGVVGLIKGGKPGKTVLLRGDMDALEVTETADVPFKSKKEGLMHACGHDGHTAGLLGAAMILNEIKDELCGNVKLMFQPSEERNGGALPMIEAGILENPKVDAAFGLHLWGTVPRGDVCVKTGAMMAAPDKFEIDLIGKGAHAAMPHLGIDPVVLSAQAILGIQSIVSRVTNPLRPLVISTCMVHGGDTFNVIPQNVKLTGTVRSLDKQVRADVERQIENVLKGLSVQSGCTYDFNFIKLYPPLINDAAMTQIARKSIGKIIGDDNVYELPDPNMGGEDFAYLCEHVPSAFFFVGINEKDKPEPVHHHPNFAWEDDVLIESSAYLAQIAYDYLNE